jgi:RNase adaptor protein for sRNA GlmZ degradation
MSSKAVSLLTYGERLMHPAVDLSVDCRILRNPYHLAPKARDEALMWGPGTAALLGAAVAKIMEALRHRDAVAVGVFCAFGQHRSPFVAQALSNMLSALGVSTSITHLSKKEEMSAVLTQ